MTAVTKGGSKEITTVPGCEVVYLSTVADGYTFASRFGKIQAMFFQMTTVGGGADPNAVGLTVSGSTITFAVSGAVTAGYLQVWGE